MEVGFAGLGRMGTPMARNLARARFAVTVWNRTEGKARALSDETECAVAATPRALAEKCDVVVTMLADDASSESVHVGPDGLFATDTPTLKVIEIGTMSPDHIAALVQSAPPDMAAIDAPVSGATQAAQDAWNAPPLKWSTQRDMIIPFSGGPEDGRQTRQARRDRAEAATG